MNTQNIKQSFDALNVTESKSTTPNTKFNIQIQPLAQQEITLVEENAQSEDSDSWGEVEFQTAPFEPNKKDSITEAPIAKPKFEDLLPNLDDLVFTTEDSKPFPSF